MQEINIEQIESQAVDAAIAQNWQIAFDLNKKIIKAEPKNIQANLRLGFAATKIAKYTDAEQAYKIVLKQQPQNQIALENLEKIELQKKSKTTNTSNIVLDPKIFVEHPGKTKCVTLNQLGQKVMLASLSVGEEVFLSIRKRHVEVRNTQGEYIGIMPDDIGLRLTHFIEHESAYSVFVQEASLNKVIVFVRELKKGKKVERMVSFPLDIPGSIAKVQNMQTQEATEVTPQDHSQDPDHQDDEDDDDDLLGDEKQKHDEDLLSDLEGSKHDDEEIIGIETEDDTDEEED